MPPGTLARLSRPLLAHRPASAPTPSAIVRQTSWRALHVLPSVDSLPFSVDTGLPPFLSSQTLKTLAIDWQEGLLDRLNQYVKGTSAQHQTLFDTIISLSQDRTQVIPFNLASEALNNSFFLNGLKKAAVDRSTTRPSEGSPLANAIEETYGSITQFISYFSNAAMGMTTSGYIWLVCDQNANLGICATYGSGTVLVQNRQQKGDWPVAIRSARIGLDERGRPLEVQKLEKDKTGPAGPSPSDSTQNSTSRSSSDTHFDRQAATSSTSAPEDLLLRPKDLSVEPPKPRVSFADSLFANPASTFKANSSLSSATRFVPNQNRAITRRNINPSERFSHLHPLMNLMVAERAYLSDYGIWGKELYLRNFWKCLDWAKVEKSFESHLPKQSTQSQLANSIWKI